MTYRGLHSLPPGVKYPRKIYRSGFGKGFFLLGSWHGYKGKPSMGDEDIDELKEIFGHSTAEAYRLGYGAGLVAAQKKSKIQSALQS